MYSIYFNNRFMAVCPKNDAMLGDPEAVLYSPGTNPELANLPTIFENSPQINKLFIPSSHQENTFKNIFTKLTHVQAGGGLVENQFGEFLLIFRNGIWDLPKGKQEPYEDIRFAALREVEEECGINDLEIKALICHTYHTYHLNNNFILKCTHWYHMTYDGNGKTCPQQEENIEKAVWIKPNDLSTYLKDTYPSIKEVFKSYLKSVTSTPLLFDDGNAKNSLLHPPFFI